VTLERDAERKALLDIAERLAADSPTSLP
jgi:hypothetical protein